MKHLTFFICTCILVIFSNLGYAQTKSIKWHTYTQPGELMYFTEYQDKIIVERISEGDNYSEPQVKGTQIVKRIDDSHYIVENEKKDGFALLKKTLSLDNQLLDISYPIAGKTAESVEEQFKTGVPIWKSLEAIRFYANEKFKELKKLPGLDQITREDLLKSLKWRSKPIGDKLAAYLKDSDGSKPYQIYRFLEAYRNKKFIELGYNPYLMVPYNFEKQFAGDEEIIKLLTEEITLE